jgi:hypothetical protein
MSGFQLAKYLECRGKVIHWLIAHNFPALPVAPAQDAWRYPKVNPAKPDKGIWRHCPLSDDLKPIPLYTGKNPSYLDATGQPHLVNHSEYQKRLPTDKELKTWFAHQGNGVGTLGGWNDAIWLDFDKKQFSSGTACDDAALLIATKVRDCSGCEPFLERSHSGGWHIGVRVSQKPDFTNFALQPGGIHVGEALGSGRFTVLAPTIGPSGNMYESLNRVELPVVETLESIGIYPVSKPKSQKTSAPAISCTPGTIDLALLVSETSRSILAGANPKGDRSHSLATLLNELYGWWHWTQDNRICVSGVPEELAHQAGQRLGIESDRIGRIIKSINDNSSKMPAALYLGGEESCWKKIYRLDRATFESLCPSYIRDAIKREFMNGIGSGLTPGNLPSCADGTATHTFASRFPSTLYEGESLGLADKVRSIVCRYDSESLQTSALMDLATTVGKSYSDIEKLARLVRLELESSEEVAVATQSLRSFLCTCRKRLNLRRYLAAPLAEALITAARAMPTAPEYLLNTLIPTAASRVGTAARIVINPHAGYVQPCIFWTANIANSGQAKTPPQSLIVDPLEDMDQENREQYQQELADWQACSDKNKGPKPVETRRILNNTTTAQKIRVHAENPRGLLEYIDELTGDFERHNQHSGGKGDDLRQELGLFNGKFGAYDRGDARLYLRRVAISKTGTYQWDTLARLMVDQVDFIASGYLARFLLCSIVDAPERKLDLFSPHQDTGLKELLRNLYRRLELLPERDYLLSREAKILFQAFNHSLVAAETEEGQFGLTLVYAKIESYAARLALWLHLVNALVLDRVPEPVISGETMQAAIELASFYLWQHKLIHAHNAPAQKLEGIFLKVQTCAEKLWAKGKALTASFAKSRINPLKSWVTPKIRDKVFRVLAAAGFGRTEGEGEKLVYIPNTVTPFPPDSSTFTVEDFGEIGVELAKPPISQATEYQVTEALIGEVDRASICSASDEGSSTQSDPDQPTNTTNLVIETVLISQSAAVGESPTESSTVGGESFSCTDQTQAPLAHQPELSLTPELSKGGLQAMLLACQTLTQLQGLRSKYKDAAEDAYRSLDLNNQLKLDGLVASQYSFPIYKYLGEWRIRNQQTLKHGDLVRLKDGKMHQFVVGVLPLDCPVREEEHQVIDVNPKHLTQVTKHQQPPQGDQLSLV